MEQELIIIGAGKFARETVWMLERLARQGDRTWKLLGYVDDTPEKQDTSVYGLPVLGTVDALLSWPRDVWAIMPMGTCGGRRTLAQRLAQAPHLHWATIQASSAVTGKNFEIGEGSLLCENTLCTVDVKLGRHTIVNVGSTISHDTVLGDFVTVSPGVTICGNCEIGDGVFLGAGATIIEQIRIAPGIVVGAGATVVRDLTVPGTYVGTPARRKE